MVTVPVLSSTIVSTRRVDSSTSGPLMRMPSCAPRPVPDHQGGRRGQPEGARAGDDQHRDGGGEGHGRASVAAAVSQNPSVAAARAITTGTNTADDPVGEPLDRRLAGLGVLDEPGDLGQRGVGADPGGLAPRAGRRR